MGSDKKSLPHPSPGAYLEILTISCLVMKKLVAKITQIGSFMDLEMLFLTTAFMIFQWMGTNLHGLEVNENIMPSKKSLIEPWLTMIGLKCTLIILS